MRYYNEAPQPDGTRKFVEQLANLQGVEEGQHIYPHISMHLHVSPYISLSCLQGVKEAQLADDDLNPQIPMSDYDHFGPALVKQPDPPDTRYLRHRRRRTSNLAFTAHVAPAFSDFNKVYGTVNGSMSHERITFRKHC